MSSTPARVLSALRLPQRVRIVEVSPRDGLQTEVTHVSRERKIEFVRELLNTGLREVETTAFVSHRRVPRLADAADVMREALVDAPRDAQLSALVPNMRGLCDALTAGARSVAVFAAATDAFSRANIGTDIEGAIAQYSDVIATARAVRVRVRAYVSVAFGGCPHGRAPTATAVARLAARLHGLGAHEIALADTLGAATPRDVVDVIAAVVNAGVPIECIAVHFHDTRGTALANVLAALSIGVSVIDAAVAGLGGCPFAPGAAGNLATEDLVHMLQGMRIDVGEINLDRLVEVGNAICDTLGRRTNSRVAQAAIAAAKVDD